MFFLHFCFRSLALFSLHMVSLQFMLADSSCRVRFIRPMCMHRRSGVEVLPYDFFCCVCGSIAQIST